MKYTAIWQIGGHEVLVPPTSRKRLTFDSISAAGAALERRGKRVNADTRGIVKDVTDEKRNEKAQEKFEINERYLATILNITSEGFYIVAPDQRFLQVNDAYCAMTGFSRDELLRMTVPEMDAAMTESEFERALEAYHETGSALFETKQKHKDGGIIDVEVYVNKIDEEGVEAVTFCRDITGRKRIEERNRQLTSDLSISLRERETLIRELYHRTKNNMQIIVSLLHIYGSEINDDSVKNVFEDMAFRINSMALVQKELYESRNLQHINMQLYLSKLTGQISESYRNPERRIAISAFSEDITLTVETAIPLGLIVNELIINSLRHAFKGREQGQINVELYKKENERLQLIVSDNGIGVPDGFSLEKEAHMGLTTVISLSHEQLMGSIIFESKDGLRVSLEFLVQS